MSGWLRGVCEAAGWTYCEEHHRPRYGPADRSRTCARFHDPETSPVDGHAYYCPYGIDDEICTCGRAKAAICGGDDA